MIRCVPKIIPLTLLLGEHTSKLSIHHNIVILLCWYLKPTAWLDLSAAHFCYMYMPLRRPRPGQYYQYTSYFPNHILYLGYYVR